MTGLLAADTRQAGEGRFVPLEPVKRQPLTRVRPLRVADHDRYKRHPDLTVFVWAAAGTFAWVNRGRSEYWRSTGTSAVSSLA